MQGAPPMNAEWLDLFAEFVCKFFVEEKPFADEMEGFDMVGFG
jgi:hypothetical protein